MDGLTQKSVSVDIFMTAQEEDILHFPTFQQIKSS